jgi:NAD(P)-dependent dehydrogenase (short-subunit alcohol dehydrogenase family)
MDSTEADWREIFEINLFAPVFLTQLVLTTMKKQKSGIIVNNKISYQKII